VVDSGKMAKDLLDMPCSGSCNEHTSSISHFSLAQELDWLSSSGARSL
jgi:hypothetical protein